MKQDEVIIDEKKNALQVNIDEDIFADMIVNFLGKKQTLSHQLKNICFKIEHNDLEQFNFLLESKLEKENTTKVSHFSAKVRYNDHTEREINSFDNFQSFYETRSVSVNSISLTWNIILRYPGNKTIENQVIELIFFIDDKEELSANPYYHNGYFLLTIQHTNQSWGIEILNLFKDHTESLLIEKSKEYNFFAKLNKFLSQRIVGTLFTFFVVFYFVFGILLSENNSESKLSNDNRITQFQIDNIKKVLDNTTNKEEQKDRILSILLITKMVNPAITIEHISSEKLKEQLSNLPKKNKEYLRSKVNSTFIFLILIFIFLYIFFKYMRYSLNYYNNKSFILLTKSSEKKYKNYKDSKSKFSFISFTILIISIICSILANMVYEYIKMEALFNFVTF